MSFADHDEIAIAQLEAMIRSRAWTMLCRHIEQSANDKIWAVANGAHRRDDRSSVVRLIQVEAYREAPTTIEDAIREMRSKINEESTK